MLNDRLSPLVSILAHLLQGPKTSRPKEIHFLYATKCDGDLDRQKILFLPRLMDRIAIEEDPNVTLGLFLSGLDGYDDGVVEHGQLPNRTFARRISQSDLLRAIDGYGLRQDSSTGRSRTLCYVCGPPKMTDEIVEFLQSQPGMAKERVMCEKWW